MKETEEQAKKTIKIFKGCAVGCLAFVILASIGVYGLYRLGTAWRPEAASLMKQVDEVEPDETPADRWIFIKSQSVRVHIVYNDKDNWELTGTPALKPADEDEVVETQFEIALIYKSYGMYEVTIKQAMTRPVEKTVMGPINWIRTFLGWAKPWHHSSADKK